MNTTDSQPLVTYHSENHVGFITLNRPEKRNALNPSVWEAIDRALDQAEKDAEARVVLVLGEGKSFCAGLDLSPDNALFAMLGAPAGAEQKMAFYREVRRAQAIHTRLERLGRPTIGRLHGHCLGAGLELALCCDILLCSAECQFALPEARLAIITDVGGLQRLTRRVGSGHAREISFRGHRFGADRAKAINLVNDVYPDREALEKAALALALEIAGNPPMAVQGAKEVFLFDQEATIEESLEYNAARSCMIVPSEDMSEAISAYLEGRPGRFNGR